MWETLWPFLVFGGALTILLKAADIFVDAAEDLGHKLRWPHFVVGVLIVGLGTSLPELASSLAAQLQKSTEIIAANIVGSNIANICLAFAIGSYFGVIRDQPKIMDLGFLGGITALFILLTSDGLITLFDGLILMILLAVFLLLTLRGSKDDKPASKSNTPYWKITGLLIGGGAAVMLSASWTITGLLGISQVVGIPEAVASMVLLAIGTSLPEVFVSVAAVKKGNGQLALGNVMGSNVINILLIGGLPALLGALIVSEQTINTGLPFFALVTVIFIAFSYLKSRAARYFEATLLLMIFTVFVGMLVLR